MKPAPVRLQISMPIHRTLTEVQINAIKESGLVSEIAAVGNTTHKPVICNFDITSNRIKNMLGNSNWRARFRGMIDRITGWYHSRNLPECLRKPAFLREIRDTLCNGDCLAASNMSRAEINHFNTQNHFSMLRELITEDDKKRLTIKNEEIFNRNPTRMTKTATFLLDGKPILKKSYTQRIDLVAAASEGESNGGSPLDATKNFRSIYIR